MHGMIMPDHLFKYIPLELKLVSKLFKMLASGTVDKIPIDEIKKQQTI